MDLIGGAGNDTLDFILSNSGVTADLNKQGTTFDAAGNISNGFGQNANGDKYAGFENIIGSNSASSGDTLTGTGTANIIDGADGADTLDGGGDVDTVSYAHDFSASPST